MIKLIIFDFDGVIENNYELHFKLSKKQIKNLTREEHRKLFEGNIHLERAKIRSRCTDFDLKKHFSDAKKNMRIKKEMENVITVLSKHYKLGIITSAKEYGINDYLEVNQIQKFFSFVYGYETNRSKVKKFNKVLEEFGLETKHCIFITDTLGDILEANEAGIKTIAVEFGYHEKSRLKKGNPFKIISNIDELIPTINDVK